jgi:hypothetical protein
VQVWWSTIDQNLEIFTFCDQVLVEIKVEGVAAETIAKIWKF